MCEIWPNPCQHLHLFGRKGQMSHLPQGGVARGLPTGARETLLADRQVKSRWSQRSNMVFLVGLAS